ncbi:MAG TPA: cyclic nucleotide-binding domain-containing protein, partial [Vicinamibacteria bacterium]|nr:cyclic nucleotide-binding domain-containing protein [Vicinamibacteria bacterium]
MPERSLQAYYPELARIGVETRIDAGGILWHEGDRGDTVALLLEGTLEVVHEPPDGEEVVLRSLEQGAVVGELAG